MMVRRLNTGAPVAILSNPNLYPWYPALDLSVFPFQTGSGAWDAQYVTPYPAAPNITRQVTVTSAAQMKTEAATPGSRIIMDFTGSIGALGTFVQDCEFVGIAGRRYVNFEFSHGFQRARITGTGGVFNHTPGALFHFIRVLNVNGTDLTIGGIDNAGDTDGCVLFNWGAERFAYVNNRMHGGRAGIFGQEEGGGVFPVHKDHVYAGNAMYNGDVDTSNSWTVRVVIRGAYIFGQNTMYGHMYHRIRCHPYDNTVRYGVTQTDLIDLNDASGIWIDAAAGIATGVARCAYHLNNRHYFSGSLRSVPRMEFTDTVMGLVDSNEFYYGPNQAGYNSSNISGPVTKTNNTFTSGIPTLPAWRGPGDPTLVPLS